ncbi:MAG: hypothetical protein ACJ716_05670 [Marmoricola sp.]
MTLLPQARIVERTGYRSPLAVSCRDGSTGAEVTDGLVASAWLRSDPRTRYTATRSPLSGVLGFGNLPRMWRASHATAGPGEPLTWPAVAPTAMCVLVQDLQERYLPVTLAVDVPVGAPVTVPLSSAPTRPPSSGFATVRGEVHSAGTGPPLGWALVRIDTGGDVYQTIADARGRFVLQVPWPEALPPLTPSGPGLSTVTWPLTVSVRSEPGALVLSPGTTSNDPPELSSVSGQGAAQLVDGGNHPSIVATLAFGRPLVLALTAVPA